jgi:uncharacterized membrane protein
MSGRNLAFYAISPIVLVTLVCELLLLKTSNPLVDGVAGLILILVVPGVVVVVAAKGATWPGDIGESLVWVAVSSLAVSVLGGLALNLLGGLTRVHWLIFMAAFVALGCVVIGARSAALGRIASLPSESNGSSQSVTDRIRHDGRTWRVVAALIAAGCLVAGSLILSQLSTSGTSEHFTQLWLLPASEKGRAVISSSPSSGLGLPSRSAELGVQNYEGTASSYVVSLFRKNSKRSSKTWSFTLVNGARWSVVITRPPGVPLTATLQIRSEQKRPIQSVTLDSYST